MADETQQRSMAQGTGHGQRLKPLFHQDVPSKLFWNDILRILFSKFELWVIKSHLFDHLISVTWAETARFSIGILDVRTPGGKRGRRLMRTTSFVSYIYSHDLMSPQTTSTSTSLIFLRHSLLQHDLRGSYSFSSLFSLPPQTNWTSLEFSPLLNSFLSILHRRPHSVRLGFLGYQNLGIQWWSCRVLSFDLYFSPTAQSWMQVL